MALIITGIFIQFLCLAVQVIQLRLGRPHDPGPQCPDLAAGWTAPGQGRPPGQGRLGDAAAADAGESDEHARRASAKAPSPDHGETAQACLELKRQDPAGE
jgi:hypothetical protein